MEKIFLESDIKDNEHLKKFSLAELSAGVYYVSIYNSEFAENFKIIKL